jgi:hypothetical protein
LQLFSTEQPPPPQHLAYVEYFTPPTHINSDSRTYWVSRLMKNQARVAAVIPVASIRHSVQLWPIFGDTVPPNWTSLNVLEECTHFRINPFLNRHTYMTML